MFSRNKSQPDKIINFRHGYDYVHVIFNLILPIHPHLKQYLDLK